MEIQSYIIYLSKFSCQAQHDLIGDHEFISINSKLKINMFPGEVLILELACFVYWLIPSFWKVVFLKKDITYFFLFSLVILLSDFRELLEKERTICNICMHRFLFGILPKRGIRSIYEFAQNLQSRSALWLLDFPFNAILWAPVFKVIVYNKRITWIKLLKWQF